MAVTITLPDLQVFVPNIEPEKGEALIAGVLARAAQIAPCIDTPDFPYAEAAKALIVDVIVRRHEAGAGSLHMQQAGPFQQSTDTRTSPRTLFWPAEIAELQRLCEASKTQLSAALPTGRFPSAYGGAPVAPLSESVRESVHYSVWPR